MFTEQTSEPRKAGAFPGVSKAGPAEALALAPGPRQPGADPVPETTLEQAHLPPGAGESPIAPCKSGTSELYDGNSSCVFERARLQPGYLGLAHTVRPRETIPIAFNMLADPLELGLVASLTDQVGTSLVSP